MQEGQVDGNHDERGFAHLARSWSLSIVYSGRDQQYGRVSMAKVIQFESMGAV